MTVELKHQYIRSQYDHEFNNIRIKPNELLVVVGSTQWVQTNQTREIYMVFDDHDVTRLETVSQ